MDYKPTLLKIYDLLQERYGRLNWWPGDSEFEVCAGSILTQNTSWTNVEKAIANLKKAGLLDARKILQQSDAELAGLIRPAGYHNLKAKRLKAVSAWVLANCNGDFNRLTDTPTGELRRDLLKIHGVGPETADCILLYALHRPVFVIDSYTRRVFSRLGLVSGDHGYQEMQVFFEDNLPRSVELFNDYHAQVVHLAKDVCKSKPACADCPLQEICQHARLLSGG